jgi:hypothetical protein
LHAGDSARAPRRGQTAARDWERDPRRQRQAAGLPCRGDAKRRKRFGREAASRQGGSAARQPAKPAESCAGPL